VAAYIRGAGLAWPHRSLDVVRGGLAERHPELGSEAVEALVWDCGYAHW
jgi:hypothetical protein